MINNNYKIKTFEKQNAQSKYIGFKLIDNEGNKIVTYGVNILYGLFGNHSVFTSCDADDKMEEKLKKEGVKEEVIKYAKENFPIIDRNIIEKNTN